MINNHHWLPDVLVGAGIGILSANLVYLTHRQVFTRWLNKQRKGEQKLAFIPTWSNNGPGVYLGLKL